jgi:hypothetical protein
LSEGYRGIVDLTPIFQKSSLVYFEGPGPTTITLNPCLAKEHQYAVSWTYYPEIDPFVFYYGNIGNVTREFEFSAFSVEEDKFEFTLIYRHYSDVDHSLLIEFVYDPLVVRSMDLIAVGSIIGGPIERSGMELKVVSQYVKPLLFLEGDSLAVGPYTLEQDVCAGWNEETAFISELGLLSLITPVISLNSTYSSSPPEYHLGVCVNPLKGSDTADDCFAVSRTPVDGGHVDACIGRGIQAHVVNQRDQGWIVLRYPYGDYFSGCKDYAVTEILFTCDHSDQLTALYPENEFWYACRYQFIWPTHLACPNVTSPSESPSPSNVSSILLGMSGSIAVLLLLVLVGVSITSCYFWRRQRTTVVNS